MANEFTKSTNIKPAILGQVANPDDYNQNIAGQSKDAIVGIDENGSFADVNLGDESLITNGALIKDIKLREGYNLKFYNASGVFQKDVNLGQATTTLLGQVELLTNAETAAATDSTRAMTASNLASLITQSTLSSGLLTALTRTTTDGSFSQWRCYATSKSASISPSGSQAFTFGSAFPTACLAVIVTPITTSPANGITAPEVSAIATTGFTVVNRDPDSTLTSFYYIAIGY